MQAPSSLLQPLLARTVSRGLDFLVRLPTPQGWMTALLLADLTAIGDLLTGADLWFGPVYLLVIALTTWSLGWVPGQAMGAVCMMLTLALNGPRLYPYAGGDVAWNAILRLAAMSLVVAVIAGARRAYLREWWLARTDPLTGALNRQAFFELGDALSAMPRWRLLLYADLDGLKGVNDRQGHAAGDECLAGYASAVRATVRREDLFARVGGDEFLVFMAVKDEAAARRVAERLHGRMNLVPGEPGNGLRCSVGALLVPPGAVSLDDLVRRADDLMYRAKQRGAALEIDVAAPCREPVAGGRARGALRIVAGAMQDAAGSAKPSRERRDPAGALQLDRLRARR